MVPTETMFMYRVGIVLSVWRLLLALLSKIVDCFFDDRGQQPESLQSISIVSVRIKLGLRGIIVWIGGGG